MGYSFAFRFSENDIDFNPKSGSFFNYNNFLINEFFNSTDAEIEVIMKAYGKHFGFPSLNYAYKTYYWGWRNGNKTLSNIQEKRILSIMPSLLTEDAKQRLSVIKEEARYKFGIQETLETIKKTVANFFQMQKTLYSKNKIESSQNIADVFSNEIDRAKNLKIDKQTYIGKIEKFYVLNNEEELDVLQVSKHIIFVKLKKQFDQIARDFNIFIPYMLLNRRGVFDAVFHVTDLNINVDIANIHLDEIAVPALWISDIGANSRFKKYSEKYLAYEIVTLRNEANKAASSSFLSENDINIFFEHYRKLFHSDSEVKMSSTFIGEGGILSINVQMKSLKTMTAAIAKAIINCFIYSAVLFSFVIVSINNKWYPILFIGGIFGVVFYISLIAEEFNLITKLKAESKLHGTK